MEHPVNAFAQTHETEHPELADQPVHKGIRCDACGTKPITGTRYKCVGCPDFDLCGACFDLGTEHPHGFVNVQVPKHPDWYRVKPPTDATPTHLGVICKSCETVVKGIRYKCGNCSNFDLCAACEENIEHDPTHIFLKIRKPIAWSPADRLLPSLYDSDPSKNGILSYTSPQKKVADVPVISKRNKEAEVEILPPECRKIDWISDKVSVEGISAESIPESSSQRFEEKIQNRGLAQRIPAHTSPQEKLAYVSVDFKRSEETKPDLSPERDNIHSTINKVSGRLDDSILEKEPDCNEGPAPKSIVRSAASSKTSSFDELSSCDHPMHDQTGNIADGLLAPEVMERKVEGLLNKLTSKDFDSISSQIIGFANQSEVENDGLSLKIIIRSIFGKAINEPGFCGICARLCKVMHEKLSNKIVDKDAIANDGKPVTGGLLFRKCLLNRCQEEFEKGWKLEESGTQPATGSAPDEQILTKESNASQEKRRRGLGLVQFVGELYNFGMLKENIMHGCIRRLLANIDSPEEEETEALCTLMITIGKQIDHERARDYIDTYIERMKVISKNEGLPFRIRCMVQDVIDLREANWGEPRKAKTSNSSRRNRKMAKYQAELSTVPQKTTVDVTKIPSGRVQKKLNTKALKAKKNSPPKVPSDT